MPGWGMPPIHGDPSSPQAGPGSSPGMNFVNAWSEADWASGCSSPAWQSPASMMPNSAPSGSAKDKSWRELARKSALAQTSAELQPVPKESQAIEGMKSGEDSWTTVMLRNLPNDYTREMLLGLLDS